MPIEIKQMSIRSNVATEEKESQKQQKEHRCDGADKGAGALSEVSSQHTAQFQTIKWMHRKLQQETRER
ncbi:hypothetical protein L3V31_15665 [Vibrio sp. J1-1]|uniref:hypothetical protein n=1 Tax=Vibrio sp. J1-1 TaxID=2912251 RepID=UPI001F33502F|nr:hypothetical protein [Vibrio sp. J1-1]MBR9876386.1 hypothetical protein [Vibrionaceae bacterium]MCF7483150.1 hypothetical protein [Vibrio sp. J1-1]